MNKHVTSRVLLGCLTFLVGCSKQVSHSGSDPLLGKWLISNSMPASLETDSAITIEDAVALAFTNGELRPAMITVTKSDLKLHFAGGDSTVMAYTLLNAEEERYHLQTDEGVGEFLLVNSKKATLRVAGATYELYR